MACVRGVSFLIEEPFPTLPSVVSSVGRILRRRGKWGEQRHSSSCLIHWAATVNVQQGGKDNFSQGRLPGTTLDHRLSSSLFSSKCMNKNAAKVCSIAKQTQCFYLLQLRAELLTLNSVGDDGLSSHPLKWINTVCDNSTIEVLYRPVSSKSPFAWQLNPE